MVISGNQPGNVTPWNHNVRMRSWPVDGVVVLMKLIARKPNLCCLGLHMGPNNQYMLCCTSLYISLCHHVTFYLDVTFYSFYKSPQLLKWLCRTSFFIHVEPSALPCSYQLLLGFIWVAVANSYNRNDIIFWTERMIALCIRSLFSILPLFCWYLPTFSINVKVQISI